MRNSSLLKTFKQATIRFYTWNVVHVIDFRKEWISIKILIIANLKLDFQAYESKYGFTFKWSGSLC